MKKLLLAACALLGFLAVFALPAVQADAKATPSFEEATIIADDVNMRMRPTVDSPFVLKLENGTRVGVFCEEVDGWYRIIYGNYRGYVRKDYVSLPSTDMLVGIIFSDETAVKLSAGDFSETVARLPAGMGGSVTNMPCDYYLL